MPKVSIVVPVYNTQDCLKETLNSIRQQTLRDIEIILIDDGSTDQSGQICDEYAKEDDRIKVVHQRNQGVSIARNTGIDIAEGDYIGFVDSDDLLHKDMYEVMYQNAINNNADISMISTVLRNLKGKEIYLYNTKRKYIWNQDEALIQFFDSKRFNIAVYTKLFRKDIAKNIQFEEGKAINEDKSFIYQAIKNANIICFEDVCKYIYIKRENSASTTKFNRKKFDAIYFANKIYQDVNDENYDDYLKELAFADMIITKMLILRAMYRDKTATKRYFLEKKEILQEIRMINMKKYKYRFSKQKKIEIFLLKYMEFMYKPIVKIFDLLFR